MSDQAQPQTVSQDSAMQVFRALKPDMDDETARLLRNSLHETDNSLFTLLMNSDWEVYRTNRDAVKLFFDYVQAGWALIDATVDEDTPIQQRTALKVLIRSLHVSLEKELDSFEEHEI
ncbi:uncharacterized protein N7496_005440 [Penicillium cataractarum]|uniref:Uncharacterized protein n=1 Tax=Penicillium cataractarum TaxID=2100454 RepID=A0A9W9SG66_9EURO|nr:uncharacterized protein N7496_005440 [Penicillium cataractarum]KAJ5378031.1 hypothetical protein N7496_005440 [Penicillium cataractarum]